MLHDATPGQQTYSNVHDVDMYKHLKYNMLEMHILLGLLASITFTRQQ